MKSILVGGFISLIGSIWVSAIVLMTSNHLVSEWEIFPGRFLTTIFELKLTLIFAISVAFVIWGVGMMFTEYFRKEN